MDIKKVAHVAAVVLCAGIFAAVVFITVWSDWGAGPLFARTYSPIFPEAHSLSLLAVLVGAYFLMNRRQSIVQGVLLGLSVAPMHDFVWMAGDVAIVGYVGDTGWHWAAFEAVCLSVAFYYANPRDRRTMLMVAVPLAIAFFAGVWPFQTSGTLTQAPNGWGAWPHSQYYYSVKDNVAEIVTWAIGPVVWIARG